MNALGNTFFVAADYVGQSVLTEAMRGAMNNGIADLTATVNDVLGVVVPAALILICIGRGATFALSKIRGLLGWAQ